MADYINVLVASLTSFAVCWFTIRQTNKNSEKALKVQRKNHEENLYEAERKHQRQLIVSQENERLKYLPYLSLFPKLSENRFEAKMQKYKENSYLIPFEISNEGAGIAFSIHLGYLHSESKPENMLDIAVAIEEHHGGGYNILGVAEPIDTDVLRVEKNSEFCLYLTAVDKEHNPIDPLPDMKWKFEILYCDIQGRKYSQSFSFYSSTRTSEIFRVNSSMPKLLNH